MKFFWALQFGPQFGLKIRETSPPPHMDPPPSNLGGISKLNSSDGTMVEVTLETLLW